jgi:hypothetical protein
MARIKFSALVSSVRGSVGSGTFQGYAGGFSLRNKPIPGKSPTSDQMLSRLYVAQVQAAWSALSPANQALWHNFVSFVPAFQKFNRNVQLSGFTLFLKYNLIRLHAGFDILSAFSFSGLEPKIFTVTLVKDGPEVNANLAFTIDSDIDWVLFKMSPVFSSASFSKKNRLRVIPIEPIQAIGVSTFRVDDHYLAKFGINLAVDDMVVCSIVHFSTVSPVMSSEVLFNVTVD